MSFTAYPIQEAVSPDSCLECLNNIYDSPQQYITDVFRKPTFSDIGIQNQPYFPSVSYNIWRKDCSRIVNESNKCTQLYPGTEIESLDFLNNSLNQEFWTNQTSSNFRIPEHAYKLLSSSKNTEIWRPFLPSPLKESYTPDRRNNSEANRNNKVGNRSLHVITPSKVKIEASKTSVFKPVKKKSYRCIHCSSTYFSSAQLISHLRVHTGAKPYTCEYPNCFKTFARNEELTRHRRIHSGYKPHLCNICGKTFGRKDHLSKHLKTHLQVSEKKVYICCVPGCGHRYTRSDALTRHRSTAHSPQKIPHTMKSAVA